MVHVEKWSLGQEWVLQNKFMSKNAAKINEGIRQLATNAVEIISGTTVPGSVDEDNFTLSVQPTDGGASIENVILNAVAGNPNGLILFPKDGSNVVIGSIDGPGEWTLIKTDELSKARITIGGVKYEMDDTQLTVQNGSVIFNLSDSVFKMNTASES